MQLSLSGVIKYLHTIAGKRVQNTKPIIIRELEIQTLMWLKFSTSLLRIWIVESGIQNNYTMKIS